MEKSLFNPWVTSLYKFLTVKFIGILVSLLGRTINTKGVMLYCSIKEFFHPVQTVNVGASILSTLSEIFAVLVYFSRYCTTTCKKKKQKKMINKIKRKRPFTNSNNTSWCFHDHAYTELVLQICELFIYWRVEFANSLLLPTLSMIMHILNLNLNCTD